MKRIDNLCQSNAFPGLVEVRPPRKPILLLIPRPCILRGIRWHAQPFLFGCTWNSLTCSAIFVRLHFKSESKWRMQFLCTWVDRTSGCLRWRAYSFSQNMHHKIFEYTSQDFRIYITRLLIIHHKTLNIHHKILNIHHKIIEYTSQDYRIRGVIKKFVDWCDKINTY